MSAKNLLGQTPLHLAADWPWACESLLKAGADVSAPDIYGNLPVTYACFQCCFGTLKTLIGANSPLSSNSYELSVLNRAAATVNDKRIFVALINQLATRRHELLRSSQKLLPIHIFRKLTSGLRGLPDIETFSLVEALFDAGGHVDPSYWCYIHASVYDANEITAEIAELLFAAGFTDLEGKDRDGFTIILRSAMRSSVKPELVFSKIGWLLTKGVSLRRLVCTKSLSKWCIPSVNVVSAMLGQVVRGLLVKEKNMTCRAVMGKSRSGFIYGPFESSYRNIDSSIKEILRRVLSAQYQDYHDCCKCWCSLQGCTPLTMLLKGWTFGWWGCLKIDEVQELRGPLIDWLLKMVADDLTASERAKMIKRALRFCLFEDMELKHVCCRPRQRSWADQDLVPPIETEEA